MSIKVDTRPLPIVVVSRWWRFPVYLALFVFLYQAYSQMPPAGLSVEGFRALSVFAACLVLWVFHLLPLPITGLFALVAPPLMGVVSPKQAFSFFGSEPVFFILSVFILAAALLKSGASTRIALSLLRGSARSPRRLLLRILLASTGLSLVMSRHAVAAMMFPLVEGLSDPIKDKPYGRSYRRLLYLAAGWGCVIGGPITMLGGGRILLAVGILHESGYGTIGFAEWTGLVFPFLFLLIPVAYWVLAHWLPLNVESVQEVNEVLAERSRAQGRMFMEERFLILLMIAAVVAWVLWGPTIGIAPIALLTVIGLFMFRVVKWKDLEENVNWGIILLLGGAIGLSTTLTTTGAGKWLAETYLLPYFRSAWLVVILLTLTAVWLSEAVNNNAIVAFLLPLALSVSQSFAMDPKIVTLILGSSAGLAYALPMSSATLALAYHRSHLKLHEVAPPALLLGLASVSALLLLAKFWWPLFGIQVPNL